MCGDTSISEVERMPENNETTEDSSTTEQDSNIPPLPTVSFDIIEIYETKLGTELCSDATEIDSTTEECFRQYRDNLEFVFGYAEDLRVYMDNLNDYFANYPSAFTEEFRDLFTFVNEKFSTVPQNYGIVASKYQQRFGNSSQPSSTTSTTTPISDNYLDYRDVKILELQQFLINI